MATIYDKAFFGDKIVPTGNANLSVASSAVLYGLSVYTVMPILAIEGSSRPNPSDQSNQDEVSVRSDQSRTSLAIFRLKDHYERLINSAKIIGIDAFEKNWTLEKFAATISDLAKANQIKSNALIRATIHVSELLPGTRSRGLETTMSIFIYEANPIMPQNGARLKTSVWRRVPDYAIPSRAKVNGAYVNSVLGKQDAIDSGYDDCLFLDASGHVCELSAANIFIVRNGKLITPDCASDILEGINRKTVIDLAQEMNIPVEERAIDLTELYIADEIFACGTSSFIAPVVEIDARKVGTLTQTNAGVNLPITSAIRDRFSKIMKGEDSRSGEYLTSI